MMKNKREELLERFGKLLSDSAEYGLGADFIYFCGMYATMVTEMEESEDVNDKIDWLLSTFADGTIMGMIFAEDESEVVS